MINEKLRDEEFFNCVVSYYENHIGEDTCKEFNLTKKQLYKLLKNFNYTKPKDKYIITKRASHEEYVLRGKKSSETQKKSWGDKSQEEKDDWSNRCKEIQSNLSQERKEEKSRKLKETMSQKSQEELDEANRKRSNTLRTFWNSLSNEEREEHRVNQINKTRETCMALYGVPYNCMREEARMSGNDSLPNRNFSNLLELNGIPFEREFRIGNYQYDFKVGNTLVEINPTITHNSTYSPFGREPLEKTYHRDKMLLAKENGYRLICVWDWDDINKVLQLLKTREKVYARNCIIKEVNKETCAKFIQDNHLQGYTNDKIRVGLFYGDSLVSVMTFGKPRYNKNCEYELIRYCSIVDVIGGANKLFHYFVSTYNPSSIVSYCDCSKFSGNVYESLGFSYIDCRIGKHWYNQKTNEHILDSSLRAKGFDKLLGEEYGYHGKGTNNADLMIENGFVEVYDCGQSTYIWRKDENRRTI